MDREGIEKAVHDAAWSAWGQGYMIGVRDAHKALLAIKLKGKRQRGLDVGIDAVEAILDDPTADPPSTPGGAETIRAIDYLWHEHEHPTCPDCRCPAKWHGRGGCRNCSCRRDGTH